MLKPNTKILAIDPGTRLIGVAVLEAGKLVYHSVKVMAKGESPHDRLRQARRAILTLVRDFAPNLVAVEKSFFGRNRNAAMLNVLVDEIKAIARRKRIELVGYAPSSVKRFITGNGRATKKEVARVVVSKYPELKVFLTQDRAWKERFHQNMFDAVGIGIMAEAKQRQANCSHQPSANP